MTRNEIILAIGGLIVSVLMYFAGQVRADIRHGRDKRDKLIQGVVDNYLSGKFKNHVQRINILVACGAATLPDALALKQVCETIVQRGGRDPMLWVRRQLPESEHLSFVQWCTTHRVGFDDYRTEDVFAEFIAKYRKDIERAGK